MNYGEESFNLAKGPNNEQYIIRDLNKEQNIENVLNRHSFIGIKESLSLMVMMISYMNFF